MPDPGSVQGNKLYTPPTGYTPPDPSVKDKPGSNPLFRAGSADYAGPTPPPGGPQYAPPTSPEYMAIVASIVAFMPAMSDDAVDVLLAAATMKMKKLEAQSDNDQVKTDTDKKRDAMAVKEEKLKEAVKKIEDAIYKEEHQSVWDKIKCAFEAIGAALSIAIGAILIATGVGAVLGGIMIVAGVAGILMTIDAICQLNGGLGLAGSLDKLAHPNDPSHWAQCEMGFQIGMAVVGVCLAVAGIASGVALANAASEVVEIADVAADVAEDAEATDSVLTEAEMTANNSTVAADNSQYIAKTADAVGNVVNATTTLATAGGDVYFSVMNYEATNDQADAKDLQADAKRMEALMQSLDGLLDMAMQHMKQHMTQWDNVLDAIVGAMNDRNQSVMRAKLGI